MRVYKVDPAGLIPQAKLVGNALNSLISDQNRGYAMIAINWNIDSTLRKLHKG